MSLYVLRRTDGQYVAVLGSDHSYTKRLEQARIYPNREAAEADRCPDNEAIQNVGSCLHMPTVGNEYP